VIRKGVLLAVTVVLAVSCSGMKPGKGSEVNIKADTAPTSAATSNWVSQLANVVDQRTGVMPTSADVYQTTRGVANQVVDANLEGYSSTDPVTVVVFTGDFTDNSARIPQGGTAPTGTTITFVVDQSTGQSTDYGIGPEPSNISQMGPVQAVPVGGPTSTTTAP
jgi:hypothetical protein